MVLKSIDVPHKTLKAAFHTLERLGLTPGPDASVELDGTVHISPGAVDSLIETYIQARAKAEPDHDTPPRPQPHRQDRTIHLPQWAQMKLLHRQASFLEDIAAAGDNTQARLKALDDWQDFRERLRLSVVHPRRPGRCGA
jgi:hypothetical protein